MDDIKYMEYDNIEEEIEKRDIRDKSNNCSCPEEHYYDDRLVKGSDFCIKCPDRGCLTCKNDSLCETCVGSPEGKILRGRSSICECPEGYYDDGENDDCIPCKNKVKWCEKC